MSKGNQLPDVVMKATKIPDFDQFFDDADGVLSDLVDWNNALDGMVQSFRKLGIDIRKYSSASPPPTIGDAKLEAKEDGTINVSIVKDGAPLAAKLDKVTKERLSMVETKAKLLTKRLKTVQKLDGLSDATFALNKKDPLMVELQCNKDALELLKKDDAVVDMKRSIRKFNDRVSLLDMQLKGPVTLAEAVSGLINSLKDELEKKSKQLKVVLQDGMPKFEGLPDSPEDFLPDLLARGWKLLKGMLDYLMKLKDDLPELEPKINDLVEKAKEMPGKVKDAATNAGLSGMEAIKAAKSVAANAKTVGQAPVMLKALIDTVKDTTLEIANAATGQKGQESKPE